MIPSQDIERLYKSAAASNAFFLTVFNYRDDNVFQAYQMGDIFPDISFCCLAYCHQQVYHVHIVLLTINAHSRAVVESRVLRFFSWPKGYRRRPSLTAPDVPDNWDDVYRTTVSCSAIHTTVAKCIDYIRPQVVNYMTEFEPEWTFLAVAIGRGVDLWEYIDSLGDYGRCGKRIMNGEGRSLGAEEPTADDIHAMCRIGVPLYVMLPGNRIAEDVLNGICGIAVREKLIAGQRGMLAWGRTAATCRSYYNRRVVVERFGLALQAEKKKVLIGKLAAIFGAGCAAALPFEASTVGGFHAVQSLAVYRGEPGIMLTCRSGGRNGRRDDDLIRRIAGRHGPFSNVEFLYVFRDP